MVTDSPVLDSWWCLPWVLGPYLPAFPPARYGFRRFTSGVAPVNILTASMVTCHVPQMHLSADEQRQFNKTVYLSDVEYGEWENVEQDVEDVDVRHRHKRFVRRQNIFRRRQNVRSEHS